MAIAALALTGCGQPANVTPGAGVTVAVDVDALKARVGRDERLKHLFGDILENAPAETVARIATQTEEGEALSWRWTSGADGGDNTVALLADKDGGYYRAGMASSADSGSKDFVLARHRADGAVTWENRYGGDERESLYAMARASDGAIWIAGKSSSFKDYSGDVYFVSVSPDGEEKASGTVGATGTDAAMALAPDNAGGMWVIGRTFQGGEGMNLYLVHLDATGAVVGERAIADAEDQQVSAATSLSDGGFAVAGVEGNVGLMELKPFVARYDAEGAKVWWKTYECEGVPHPDTIALAAGPDGMTLAFSSFTPGEHQVSWRDNVETQDAYALAFDLQGEERWRTRLDGDGWDATGAIAVDGSNTLVAYTSASFEPATDNIVFARLDATGAIAAQRLFDSEADDSVAAMAVLADGMIALGGTVQPKESDSSQDAYVLKATPDGRAWVEGLPYDRNVTARDANAPGAPGAMTEMQLPEGAVKAGDVAPEVYAEEWLNTAAGITLEELRGKTVVVEFWATWCGPCKASIPHLIELQHKYAPQGLVCVSLTDEDRAEAKVDAFMAEMKMDYIVGTGSEAIREYGVTGIPTAFVIDKTGVVTWRGHPMSGLDEAIVKAL